VDSALFRPLDAPWRPVSTALTTHRRLVLCGPLAVVALALAFAAVVVTAARGPALVAAGLGATAVVALAVAAATWWWAERNRRSWGHAESEDDLLVTSGVMFRRLVVVPLGRVQFVDVEAGPVERRLGIARVTLHTASTETAATIPGLPAGEAQALRDRLTDLGQVHDGGV
jgi:membrane protein YdbS with pleckstrin-like domain